VVSALRIAEDFRVDVPWRQEKNGRFQII
jgi:hypothetical protein